MKLHTQNDLGKDMSRQFVKFGTAIFAASLLGGCVVAKTTGKVAALPFKAAYKTTEVAGKTVVGTGKIAGKTAFGVGKGLYYIGSVPVKITDKALDTTTKVLVVTTKMVDLTGTVITTSRRIQATELDSELRSIRAATNIVSVLIDAI